LWAAARLAKMRKKGQTIYGLEIVPEGYAGHVVLLAEDTDGWRTLCLVGRDGLKMGQVLTGVHLLTGGADGILVKGKSGAWQGELLGKLRAMVSEGKLWVELAPTQGERWVELWNLANEHDLPVVATGDVSYAERESRQAWHVMRAIGERRRLQRGGAWEAQEGPLGAEGVAEQGGSGMGRCWGHLASTAEMSQFFTRCPAALRNAADLAARCQVKLRLGVVALPDYVADDGRKLDAAGQVDELRRQAEEGLRERLLTRGGMEGETSEYWSRLSYELNVIAGTGFAGYFLIYADFVRWGKRNGVPFGPGRGSAAGSLVVWALGITECDPIVHNLLFERFLNPERVSSGGGLPDIDIDICKRRRGDVVEYLRSRYGRDSVGRIINFKVLVGKTALKDVGRAFGIGYHRLNALTAGVPMTVKGKTPKLAWMVTEVQALREAVATDSELARVVKVALELEGCIRESGVHASGIVVSRGPLADWVPTIHAKGGELCSAWDMREAEDAGLVKLDLLGLSTVTMIDLAERMAGVKVDQSLNDAGTFALMGRGDTHGVFQMGKGGFRRMLRELKPDRFGDVVAAGALYRPGPIQGGMVKAYCRRKHGQEKVEYIHPLLESVTGSTYACLTYQEQVMSSARVLAGYSLGEADILRRAMGKKKPEEMRAQRAKFVDGCLRLGTCDAKQASEIFDLIDHFSGYGFNVSHSTAYGMLSYYTGWLKQHHPISFYAALLSILTEEADSYVKIAETIYDIYEHNIRVLPPDVNQSRADFTPEAGAVRYGLRGLRGLGKAAVLAIVAAQP
jgi:DNA polymerase-3 subunit alpha